MTAEKFDRTLRTLQELRPVRPVTVELHGGRQFDVDDPRMIAYRDGVAVYLAPGGRSVWFDHGDVSQIMEPPANTP